MTRRDALRIEASRRCVQQDTLRIAYTTYRSHLLDEYGVVSYFVVGQCQLRVRRTRDIGDFDPNPFRDPVHGGVDHTLPMALFPDPLGMHPQ